MGLLKNYRLIVAILKFPGGKRIDWRLQKVKSLLLKFYDLKFG